MVFLWFSYGLPEILSSSPETSTAQPVQVTVPANTIIEGVSNPNDAGDKTKKPDYAGGDAHVKDRGMVQENHRKTIGKWWFHGI